MVQVKAKKYLGQHFLRDENIAQNIVESLSPDTQNLVEIGPGMGVLTKYIIQKPQINFYVVEIDTESVAFLQEHYPLLKGKIISDDFLKYDLNTIFSDKFSVIGNFPYNISSQILFKVLEYRNQVTEVVGMFQKEVAERIAAKPNSKTYGILSVLLKAFYDIEYLFTVHEHVFSPPPKVKSAVIRVRRNVVDSLDCDEELFVRVVKTGFNQRRKTLRNALKPLGFSVEDSQNVLFDKRAEQLDVADFITLTKMLSSTRKNN